MKGFSYGEVMRSSFGLGLVLMIVGMGMLALQGLAHPADGGAEWASLGPVAGGVSCALGLSLMLAARQD